jgi:MarR family transcriptional regulator, organic hydroperoxide resistance regulator
MADEAAVGVELERVAALFGQIMRLQRRASPRDWMELDLSMAQMKAMFVLHHDGPAKVSDLAEALGVSAPSMTGTLERLVRHGLIERRDDPSDRRLVIIALTPAGQALVERLHQGRRQRLLAALARLDASTVDDLERGLLALRESLETTEHPSSDQGAAPRAAEPAPAGAGTRA